MWKTLLSRLGSCLFLAISAATADAQLTSLTEGFDTTGNSVPTPTGIFAQSQPKPDSIEIARQLAAAHKYFMATINNEILELNLYRIEQFGLRRYFSVFFSSCFLGLRKPDEAIYRTALQVSQHRPAECIFIDDREVNLECPRELGLATILFRDAAQLRQDLQHHGVEITD